MDVIRVLSIDGGGIKGIIPATILVHLEQYLKEYSEDESAYLGQYFDLIAGTSTGSILTCLFLMPNEDKTKAAYSAKEALELYLSEGNIIFSRPAWYQFKSAYGAFGAKYCTQGINKLLNKYFGSTTLSELMKPCLIPVYDMQSAESLFFNQKTGLRVPKRDFYIKDILRGSTAAPTFFSPAKITDSQGQTYTLIDGGVFANNPAMCAYVEASKLDVRGPTEDMMMLSLGTGITESQYEHEAIKHWGAAQWAIPLLNIFGSGASETVDHQLKTLFRLAHKSSQYIRIESDTATLKVSPKMDDISKKNIKALQQAGETLAKEHELVLRRVAKQLVNEEKRRKNVSAHLTYRSFPKR